MKVGLILHDIAPERGGAYTFVSEIFHSLLEFESETPHNFVIFGRSKEIPKEILLSKNLQYVSLHNSLPKKLLYRWFEIQTATLKKLRNPRATRFRIESWYEKFFLKCLINNGIDISWNLSSDCITMEQPYITTVWDLQHRLQPYFPEVSTNGEWDNREEHYATMLRRASFVLTGTEVGKTEIQLFYQVPADRIKVVPFPTPSFVLRSHVSKQKQILEKYNIPHNYLFYPAQFWSHKNHVGLLLAVKWLKVNYDLVFPVVFSGSDKGNKQYIKQIVDELDLSKQVNFLGFVPQEDLISLYRNAFALTFLTFFGPDNLPPLEAFALGCPVVASNVSGAEEQLGDAALLVDPKDTEQIALAIKSLWDNMTLRQTLVQRGLERASKWTVKNYLKGVFSILDEFAAIRRCWN